MDKTQNQINHQILYQNHYQIILLQNKYHKLFPIVWGDNTPPNSNPIPIPIACNATPVAPIKSKQLPYILSSPSKPHTKIKPLSPTACSCAVTTAKFNPSLSL